MNIRKENCCKKLIGAGSEELCEDGISQIEKAELRRTRLDLIGKEYEVSYEKIDRTITTTFNRFDRQSVIQEKTRQISDTTTLMNMYPDPHNDTL
jgi:hypothetical protein